MVRKLESDSEKRGDSQYHPYMVEAPTRLEMLKKIHEEKIFEVETSWFSEWNWSIFQTHWECRN